MEIKQWKEFLEEWFAMGYKWGNKTSITEVLDGNTESRRRAAFKSQMPDGEKLAWNIRYDEDGELNLGWCWEGWYKERGYSFVFYDYNDLRIPNEENFDDLLGLLTGEREVKDAVSA